MSQVVTPKKSESVWYVCKICRRAYDNVDRLRTHKNTEHYDLLFPVGNNLEQKVVEIKETKKKEEDVTVSVKENLKESRRPREPEPESGSESHDSLSSDDRSTVKLERELKNSSPAKSPRRVKTVRSATKSPVKRNLRSRKRVVRKKPRSSNTTRSGRPKREVVKKLQRNKGRRSQYADASDSKGSDETSEDDYGEEEEDDDFEPDQDEDDGNSEEEQVEESEADEDEEDEEESEEEEGKVNGNHVEASEAEESEADNPPAKNKIFRPRKEKDKKVINGIGPSYDGGQIKVITVKQSDQGIQVSCKCSNAATSVKETDLVKRKTACIQVTASCRAQETQTQVQTAEKAQQILPCMVDQGCGDFNLKQVHVEIQAQVNSSDISVETENPCLQESGILCELLKTLTTTNAESQTDPEEPIARQDVGLDPIPFPASLVEAKETQYNSEDFMDFSVEKDGYSSENELQQPSISTSTDFAEVISCEDHDTPDGRPPNSASIAIDRGDAQDETEITSARTRIYHRKPQISPLCPPGSANNGEDDSQQQSTKNRRLQPDDESAVPNFIVVGAAPDSNMKSVLPSPPEVKFVPGVAKSPSRRVTRASSSAGSAEPAKENPDCSNSKVTAEGNEKSPSQVRNLRPRVKIEAESPQPQVEHNSGCVVMPEPANATATSPVRIECWMCPDSQFFSRLLDLEIHMKEFHHLFSLKLFGCPKCDCEYSSVATLRHHLITIHKMAGEQLQATMKLFRYRCDMCDKTFGYPGYVYHVRTIHMKTMRKETEKQFSCDICQKKFISKAGLLYHEKSHSNTTTPSEYQCNVCPKVFRTTGGLTYHQSKNHQEGGGEGGQAMGNVKLDDQITKSIPIIRAKRRSSTTEEATVPVKKSAPSDFDEIRKLHAQLKDQRKIKTVATKPNGKPASPKNGRKSRSLCKDNIPATSTAFIKQEQVTATRSTRSQSRGPFSPRKTSSPKASTNTPSMSPKSSPRRPLRKSTRASISSP